MAKEKDFYVSCDAKKFSAIDLNKNKKFFNKEDRPAYFTEIADFGVTYWETILVDCDELEGVGQLTGGEQPFRATKNNKYLEVEDQVMNNGIDLREKPLQILVEMGENKDGLPCIKNVLEIFNGNTLHDIMTKKTSLTNRICAVYTKNSDYSKSNLVALGHNQNNLQNPFGKGTEEDLKINLERMMELGSFYLKPNPTKTETSEWFTEVKAKIRRMNNVKKDVDTSKRNQMLNDLYEKVSKTTRTNRSFKNGSEAMEILKKKGFNDTPTVKYKCLSGYPDNIYSGCVVISQSDEDFDFKNNSVEMIIHFGHPNLESPLNWFFKKVIKFWEHWKLLNGMVKPGWDFNLRIIGAYQQLDCLSHIWELDSVVPFEEIVKYKGDRTIDEVIARVRQELKDSETTEQEFEYDEVNLDESVMDVLGIK